MLLRRKLFSLSGTFVCGRIFFIWQEYFFSDKIVFLWRNLAQKLVSVMETCFLKEMFYSDRNFSLTETCFWDLNFISVTEIHFCHRKLFCYSNLFPWQKLVLPKIPFFGHLKVISRAKFTISWIIKIITLWSPALQWG